MPSIAHCRRIDRCGWSRSSFALRSGALIVRTSWRKNRSRSLTRRSSHAAVRSRVPPAPRPPARLSGRTHGWRVPVAASSRRKPGSDAPGSAAPGQLPSTAHAVLPVRSSPSAPRRFYVWSSSSSAPSTTTERLPIPTKPLVPFSGSISELPDDPAALHAFALACQSELKAAETAVQLKALEIEKLRFQIAKLRRMQFGRSSERIARQITQLELQLEELETGAAEDTARAEATDPPAPTSPRADKPKRKPLPDHLPRQEVVHLPLVDGACTCPDCGRSMAKLGEDITEVLDYVPGHFQVIRHVRPKFACCACDAITQASAPAMPTPRGRATPATLAHLLVAKYSDHLPLYRQSEIYAREGSNSIARRCAIGLDKRPGCWILSWRRSGVMSWPPRRSTATTRRFRCSHLDWAGPRPGVCGSMCATTGRSAALHRRLPHTSTVPIAVASIRLLTWLHSPGSCRPMAMPGSRPCMVRSGLRRV